MPAPRLPRRLLVEVTSIALLGGAVGVSSFLGSAAAAGEGAARGTRIKISYAGSAGRYAAAPTVTVKAA